MQICPALPQDGAFLSGMLGYVDCEARTVGANGYLAMANSGSTVGALLVAVLTIFIALIGYRMLLGALPTSRSLVISAVKVGIVLILATSWPAFRTLAYDVVMDGPASMASEIGRASGLPGSGGDLVGHLQAVDDELIELAYVGTNGALQSSGSANPDTNASNQPNIVQPQYQQLIADPIRNAQQLATARTVYLTATIAGFSSVRIVAGLLLALGPLFALFLLFDATRGLFEGWVRTLVAAALGTFATTIVLGIQIALLEPWLAAILQDRAVQIGRPEVPVELMVATLVFGLVELAALVVVAKAAYGFRMPGPWREWAQSAIHETAAAARRERAVSSSSSLVEIDRRSRAVAVADAIAASQRRENLLTSGFKAPVVGYRNTPGGSPDRRPPIEAGQDAPLGRSWRRPQERGSASAQRRDQRG